MSWHHLSEILLSEAGLVAGLLFVACLGLVWAVQTLWRAHAQLQADLQHALEEQANVTREATTAIEQLRTTVAEQGRVVEMLGQDLAVRAGGAR